MKLGNNVRGTRLCLETGILSFGSLVPMFVSFAPAPSKVTNSHGFVLDLIFSDLSLESMHELFVVEIA